MATRPNRAARLDCSGRALFVMRLSQHYGVAPVHPHAGGENLVVEELL